MTTLHERLVDIFTPTVRDLRPPSEMAHQRAVQSAVDGSGHVRQQALIFALPWQARDFSIAGAVSTGANVAQQYRVRQASRLVYVDALCKTAPTGGPLTLTIHGPAESKTVSIDAGATSTTNAFSEPISAGALLTLDVTAANGAEDVTVTAWLVPDTEG